MPNPLSFGGRTITGDYMRYLVQRIVLDKDHPCWPNEEVFKLLDRNTGHVSFGCYTTLEVAQGVADRKNG